MPCTCHAHAHAHVHAHAHDMYICMCACVCVRACMCVRVCVCVRVLGGAIIIEYTAKAREERGSQHPTSRCRGVTIGGSLRIFSLYAINVYASHANANSPPKTPNAILMCKCTNATQHQKQMYSSISMQRNDVHRTEVLPKCLHLCATGQAARLENRIHARPKPALQVVIIGKPPRVQPPPNVRHDHARPSSK